MLSTPRNSAPRPGCQQVNKTATWHWAHLGTGLFGTCTEASARGKISIYKLSVCFRQKGNSNKTQSSYFISLSTYFEGSDGTKKTNSFVTPRAQFITAIRDYPKGQEPPGSFHEKKSR